MILFSFINISRYFLNYLLLVIIILYYLLIKEVKYVFVLPIKY